MKAGIPKFAMTILGGVFSSVVGLQGQTITGWGFNGSGQLTPPAGLTGVVDIKAGADFVLALKSDGTVAGWDTITMVRQRRCRG
ncbi:MAG: hypothetical protein LAP61_23540 [Acidobacteriia bacterium]|nr:hypothetical protein [Terriglobia bacterium]